MNDLIRLHTPLVENLERRARLLAEGGPEEGDSWERLGEILAEQSQSFSELRLLVDALREKPASSVPPPEQPARVGYVLVSPPGSGMARAIPALAEALAGRQPVTDLLQRFADLWAVDFNLWLLLTSGQTDTRVLALAWLKSPGRRLVQDLSTLGRLPSASPLGATAASLQELDAAAGSCPKDAAHGAHLNPPWYELHAAIPGLPLWSWQPSSANDEPDSNSAIREALWILEGRRGEPAFLRGAALGWLLNRAAKNPHYQFDDLGPGDPERERLTRNLREDLLPALIAGFPPPTDTSRYARLRTAVQFEAICLQHAARLTSADSSPDAVARAWRLARWLQSCTFRSPFFGGDEEDLTVRLRALLPESPASIPRRDDVLDPFRFAEDQGLDLAEVAIVSAVAWHYSAKDTPKLELTPLPVVHLLRRIARRQLRSADREAEECLARHLQRRDSSQQAGPTAGNALGWEAPHISPPLLARRLMSELHIGWLKYVPTEIVYECLELFEQQPLRHPWVASALCTEGADLPHQVRERAAGAWREVLRRRLPGGPQCRDLFFNAGPTYMAAGVLDQLTDAEVQQAVQLAQTAMPEWRHRALERLAEAAEELQRDAAWRMGVDGLMDMLEQERLLEDPKCNDQERVNTALFALRRISNRPLNHPDRPVYLQRLAAVASRPPFTRNYSLWRELRRLGVRSNF